MKFESLRVAKICWLFYVFCKFLVSLNNRQNLLTLLVFDKWSFAPLMIYLNIMFECYLCFYKSSKFSISCSSAFRLPKECFLSFLIGCIDPAAPHMNVYLLEFPSLFAANHSLFSQLQPNLS